jgi:hypothetical protein
MPNAGSVVEYDFADQHGSEPYIAEVQADPQHRGCVSRMLHTARPYSTHFHRTHRYLRYALELESEIPGPFAWMYRGEPRNSGRYIFREPTRRKRIDQSLRAQGLGQMERLQMAVPKDWPWPSN